MQDVTDDPTCCPTCAQPRLPDLEQIPAEQRFMGDRNGGRIDLLHPRPQDVDLEEMAHQLAMQPRFNGAIDFFYGVGEHSLNVAFAVNALMGGATHPCARQQIFDMKPPVDANPRMFWGSILRALLHDGSEAPLGDVIRPLKALLPNYRRLEALHMRAIHTHFGFGSDASWATMDKFIGVMDYATFAVEDHVLRQGPPSKLTGVTVRGMEWMEAKDMFIELAEKLMHEFAPYRETMPDENVAS